MLERILNKDNLIFLAEDDDDDAFFVSTALSDLDTELKLMRFCNGKDLYDSLKDAGKPQPQLVILDLNMPVLDGRTTLKLIRDHVSIDIPVIILSTSSHPEEKQKCMDMGATQYYSKPYSYRHYLEILRKLKVDWIDKVHA